MHMTAEQMAASINTCLAKAMAYKKCGKFETADTWAKVLVWKLKDQGFAV